MKKNEVKLKYVKEQCKNLKTVQEYQYHNSAK